MSKQTSLFYRIKLFIFLKSLSKSTYRHYTTNLIKTIIRFKTNWQIERLSNSAEVKEVKLIIMNYIRFHR